MSRDGLNTLADQWGRGEPGRRAAERKDTLAAASPGSPWSYTTSLFSTSNPEARVERQSGHRGSQHSEAANGIVRRSGMGWKIETQSLCSRNRDKEQMHPKMVSGHFCCVMYDKILPSASPPSLQ